MNTGKQINAMVVVLFLTLVAVGVYAIWDPFRAETAEDRLREETVERAVVTYTQNCRLCHGDAGQGGPGGAGRLAAAAQLDTPDLRGIRDGAFDQAFFDSEFDRVFDTITCGRVGTQMPTWGATEGGTLNEEQVRQLAVLITGGDPSSDLHNDEGFWYLAQEHADEIDAETTGHAELDMPDGSLSATATEVFVSDAGAFSRGQYIRIRVDETSEERMRILPNALRVERGAGGTEAVGHDVGAAILDEDGNVVFDRLGDVEQALVEAIDDETTLVVAGDPRAFSAGDVIQIDDEQLEVTDVVGGLPTTNLRLARETGREPQQILVSGSAGLEADMIVRIDSELLEIVDVRDDGATGIVLNEFVSATGEIVSVSDPVFFAEDYVMRIGSELISVIGPVETGQALGETIGRAQTRFEVSGTRGIEVGMAIRMDSELIRVDQILDSARLTIERAAPDGEGNATQAATHAAGTPIIRLVASGEEGAEVTFDDIEQALLEGVNSGSNEIVVTGTAGISIGDTLQLGDELVAVTDVSPASIQVRRGFRGTSVEPHARRVDIYDGNLLEVERAFGGTSAATHDEDAEIFMTEIEVRRERDGSQLQDHSKNAEVFLGNSLIVERGVKDTEAVEHQNGSAVLDFPTAPDDPPIVPLACGQAATGGGNTTRPDPIAGSTAVDIVLSEWEVDPTPGSVAAGLLSLIIENAGTAQHNLRVIATDLPADGLPVENSRVVEEELDVIALSGTITPGAFELVPSNLDAGRYVLICNIPTHYSNGMFTEFQVQ